MSSALRRISLPHVLQSPPPEAGSPSCAAAAVALDGRSLRREHRSMDGRWPQYHRSDKLEAAGGTKGLTIRVPLTRVLRRHVDEGYGVICQVPSAPPRHNCVPVANHEPFAHYAAPVSLDIIRQGHMTLPNRRGSSRPILEHLKLHLRVSTDGPPARFPKLPSS